MEFISEDVADIFTRDIVHLRLFADDKQLYRTDLVRSLQLTPSVINPSSTS